MGVLRSDCANACTLQPLAQSEQATMVLGLFLHVAHWNAQAETGRSPIFNPELTSCQQEGAVFCIPCFLMGQTAHKNPSQALLGEWQWTNCQVTLLPAKVHALHLKM